jgi:predicted nucleotidyltransferase
VSEVDALAAALSARAEVRLAYVFRSAVTGRRRAASDADVAVLFAGAPGARALDGLTEDLEAAAGRRIDLVDLATAPPLLAHEIVKTGRCIVCRDATERGEFEARTVLRFLDTAHLRRIQDGYLRERAEARRGRSG